MPATPEIHRLTDGSILTDPQHRQPIHLARGNWVRLGGRPWQIRDLLAGPDGARVVILSPRSNPPLHHPPVRVPAHGSLEVYLQIQPPTGPPPRRTRR